MPFGMTRVRGFAFYFLKSERIRSGIRSSRT
jgi:hypothetical protein